MKSFSKEMKKIISTNRSQIGIIINDKIKVKDYVDERIPGNDLFDHRIYAGYSIGSTLEACKQKPCVVRANNAWHKMKFLFDDKDVITKQQLITWQQAEYTSAEWAYKQIKPGFTVEKLLPKKHNLLKFFVFHGKVEYIWQQVYDVSSKKIGLVSATMHDSNWNNLKIQWNRSPFPDCPKPEKLQEMIDIAGKLFHTDFDFMRCDLYYNDGIILLSELMQYHAGGTNGFGDFDYILGGKL